MSLRGSSSLAQPGLFIQSPALAEILYAERLLKLWLPDPETLSNSLQEAVWSDRYEQLVLDAFVDLKFRVCFEKFPDSRLRAIT